MPRKEVIHIQQGNSMNALFKGFAIAPGKIGPSDSLVENQIAGEERPFVGPIDTDGTRGMTRGV